MFLNCSKLLVSLLDHEKNKNFQNTVYVQDLETKINKYDTEVKNMKFKYKSLFEEIKEVDAAIAQKGNFIREYKNRHQA